MPDGEKTADAGEKHEHAISRATATGLHLVEDVIYALAALLLAGGALVVLGEAVYDFATTVSDGITKAIKAALDSMLIVFILVELLSAVRSALDERRLVAEPFLLVGILAAIKEIVVISTFPDEKRDLTDAMLEVGVLAAVVIGLSVATLFLRRRQREPKEGEASTST